MTDNLEEEEDDDEEDEEEEVCNQDTHPRY